MQKIINDTKEEDVIAIVTHGGMINQLYYSFLGLSVASGTFFGTGDTGVHVWKLQDGVRRILKANMTEHTKGI